MAVFFKDLWDNGRRVEAIIVDPTGKTQAQIEAEAISLAEGAWPTASGFTHEITKAQELCSSLWSPWYLNKIWALIQQVTTYTTAAGGTVVLVTISQP